MPFVPDSDQPQKKRGFVPDTAAPPPAADGGGFRLGPGASAIARPIGGAVGQTLGMFDRPRDYPKGGGGKVHIPSIEEEFQQFVDKYTTKPTTKVGRIAEGAATIVAGGLMPGGGEIKAAKEGEKLVGGLEPRVGEVARDVVGAAKGMAEDAVITLTQRALANNQAITNGFKVAAQDAAHPSMFLRAVSEVAGADIANKVSRTNAERFNELGRLWLNQPEGTPLIDKTFEQVRKDAHKPFETLRSMPNIREKEIKMVRDEASTIGAKEPANVMNIATEFPGQVSQTVLNDLTSIRGAFMQNNMNTSAALDLVKMWRNEAKKNLRSDSVEANYKGTFQRQAADVMEHLLELHAGRMGQPDLMKDIRNGRKLIARSYALEDSTNTVTGNVNPEWLKAIAERQPLDAEGKIMADFATAHPFSSRSIDRIGGTSATVGKLRFFLAAGAFMAGHPQYASAIAAEEVATHLGASGVGMAGGKEAEAGAQAAGKPRRKFSKPAAAAIGARQASGALQGEQ